MTQRPFRILALNGGGARGVFQAVYLAKLAQAADSPLCNRFDLIAGTSTGAIIALAIALKIDPNRIVDLFRHGADGIFASRFAASVRRGPRYRQEPLRQALTELFAGRNLAECHPPVLITASSLDRFSYRIFSTLADNADADGKLLAVDVALASAAAPTLFPPVSPVGQNRSYVDGGLWANSPVLVAVLTAHHQNGVPLDVMRVMSVGNGEFPHGIQPSAFAATRPLGFKAIRSIFEIMFATQTSFADEYAMQLLPAGNFLRVNAVLDEDLPLDDTEKALSKLPALAEAEFDRTRRSALDLFSASEAPSKPVAGSSKTRPAQFVSRALVEAAGLSAFYPSRAHYAHRNGASSIDRYIATARLSLVMVSINLMTGVPFDGMLDVLEKKLESRDITFAATISLLNPRMDHLMRALAPVLDVPPHELSRFTEQTIDKLLTFRGSLSESAQKRLRLRLHDAIPFGSAIMLDHAESDGRIQIETKSYRTPVRKSFAFEVMRADGDDDLYNTLLSAYERLINDGRDMDSSR